MDEKITIKCDKCKKQFTVPSSMAGKRARCVCGNIVRVQAAAGAEAKGAPKWYYASGGTRSGPVAIEEIRRLRADGTIGDDDLVWCKGMATWATAATVAEINEDVDETAKMEPAVGTAEPEEAEQAAESATAQSPAEAIEGIEEDGRQWYYAKDGAQAGPLSTADLGAMFRSAELDGSVVVWSDGMDGWVAASEVAPFSSLLKPQALAASEVAAPAAAEEKPVVTEAKPAPEKPQPAARPAQAVEAVAAGEPAAAPAAPASSAAPAAVATALKVSAPVQYAGARFVAGVLGILGVVVAVLLAAAGTVVGVMALKASAVAGVGLIALGVCAGAVALLVFQGMSHVLRILADLGERQAAKAAAMAADRG